MINEQDFGAPSSQATLVILLGASQWPHDSIEFPASEAFKQAAERIKEYFTKSLCLPEDNILWLFNTSLSANAIEREIYEHLEIFKGNAKNVIIYYIGHAKRTTRHNQLYLAINDTQQYNPEGTSLKIESLAKTVLAQARNLRRFYILDCCFAASAIQDLQGFTEIDSLNETFDAVENQTFGEVEHETRGCAALFSAGKSEAAAILPDHTNTFFTAALLRVLSTGDPHSDHPLSIRDVFTQINTHLNALYKNYLSSHSEIPKPPFAQIYAGNLAEYPIFSLTQSKHSEHFAQLIQREEPLVSTHMNPQDFYIRITSERPVIDDPLKDNSYGIGWDTRKSESGTASFWKGAFHVSTSQHQFNYYCAALSTDFTDFAYQIQMKIMRGEAGGIIFRGDEVHTRFYLLRIDRHGNYYLYLFVDKQGDHAQALMRGSAPISIFNSGLGKSNLVAVIAHRSSLSLFVNKQFVTSANNTILTHGQIGVVVYAYEKPTSVVYSNAQVWELS